MSDFLDRVLLQRTERAGEWRAQARMDMRHLSEAFGVLGARLMRDAAINVVDGILEQFQELGRGYTTAPQQELLRRARLLVLSVPRGVRGYGEGDE